MPLFADPTFGDLPRDCRLLYLGLRDLADEHGQVRSDPRYIKGEVFRYDDDLTATDVDLMINEIAETGKIHRIPGYIVVSDPAPDPDTGDALFAVPTKTRTTPPIAVVEAAFDAFWAHYPRRKGKGAARKAWLARIAAGTDPRDMLTAVMAYAEQCKAIDKEIQYIPYPSVWLNQERYDDDPEQAPQVRSRVDDAYRQGMQLTEYYRQQERLEGGEPPKEIGW